MKVPEYVTKIVSQLEKSGYEAYIVGGCVRDILQAKTPKDWDVTTNALPEQILDVFPDGKYENRFGTVLLPIEKKEEAVDVVEITTYRSEVGYSDRRRPDEVKFEKELDKDLSRRDFTINALAMKKKSSPVSVSHRIKDDHKIEKNGYIIIDFFGGEEDINKKIIRAVGEPLDRFKEDALRMMRAIRLAVELDFDLEPKTRRAIYKMAGAIKFIAKERVRDELIKILESDRAYEGIMMLHDNKLLQYILPELEEGVNIDQNRHHIYTVFEHNVYSLKNCPNKDWRVRFAALVHDIAKPKTRKMVKGEYTFYNHEYLGAKMVTRITKRLKFSHKDADKIITLVKAHMFYYNVGEVTESSVRRLIRKVGEENLKDLIDLRVADRLGSGVPKAKPYKLRHLEYMMKKVRKDPISVKMLKINGEDLMKELKLEPGPKIGAILDVLLGEVLDDPKLNTKKYLLKRARELDKAELDQLREWARDRIGEEEDKKDKKIKKEFWVK